ncbi:MAG: alpha/beta fold hydrolase [Actinomycetes bacterium]
MNVVLVHGAFRGGWSFDRLRPLLDDHVATFAPDLLGMGRPDATTAGPVTLDDWCAQLLELVRSADLRDVVLVGHSQGGLVVRALGDRLDDRVRLVAYLDAPLADVGQRGVDLMGGPPPDPALLPPRGTVLPPAPVEPDGDVSAALAEWINARLGPTPFGPSLDPVTARPSAAPTVSAFCAWTPDAFPSAVTRRQLDAEGRPYDLLDAPHDAPITHPAVVAGWLLGHLGLA